MNYFYKRSLLSFALFTLIFSMPAQAVPSDWIKSLFSIVGEDGMIPIFKMSDNGYSVNSKGLVTLAIFTVFTAKALSAAAEGSCEIVLPLVMKVCPIKSWKEDYNRKQEGKQLDKELEIIELEKKRNKVMKLKEEQSLADRARLDDLKKKKIQQ